MLQTKQQEYLKPYLEKIYAALQVVLQEQKYTHVFKKDVFIYADKSDELMLRVIQKLKIPVPRDVEEQIKALGGAAQGAQAPAKAPAKKG